MRRRALLAAALGAAIAPPEAAAGRAAADRAAQAEKAGAARLGPALAQAGPALGAPAYLRIFKAEAVLELWMEAPAGAYALVKSYPICAFSGRLGPKLREGDGQAPEGFYAVKPGAMNPASAYHLSFNLGYPNAFDRAHGRTGAFLMVHGACVSIGCYAMTDPAIEEIWAAMTAAFAGGQAAIPVHAFPFAMTAAALAAHAEDANIGFWRQLAPAFAVFEAKRIPPATLVRGGRYVVLDQA